MKKIVLIICGLLIVLLAGCGNGDIYTYSEYEKYNKGGSEISERIDKVNIDWISGTIRITYYNGDTIKFYEESNVEISEEREMRYYYNNSELYIKFAKSGMMNWALFDKKLFVMLPYTTTLKECTINNVSSEINFTGGISEKINIDNVSGYIGLYGSLVSFNASEININNVSGRVNIQNFGTINSMEIENVSGKIDLKGRIVDKLNLETVSGSINCQISNLKNVELNTVSGKIEVNYIDDQTEFDIESVSGDVIIYSNVLLNCILEIETASGNFESDYECKIIEEDIYQYQSGNIKNRIETVSGNINIKKYFD